MLSFSEEQSLGQALAAQCLPSRLQGLSLPGSRAGTGAVVQGQPQGWEAALPQHRHPALMAASIHRAEPSCHVTHLPGPCPSEVWVHP